MKNLIDPRTLARYLYYSSPESFRKLFWKCYLFYVKNRILLKNPQYGFEMQYINPNDVRLIRRSSSLGEKFKNIETVQDGNWDQVDITEFDVSSHFIAMNDHFLRDVPFLETNYYQKILQKINDGEILWGCYNKNDLTDRFNQIDELFRKIKNSGYLSQRDLGNSAYLDEITVNIGRNGELIFEEGFHRLAIAKILKLPTIPVIITLRHAEWVKFRQEVSSYIEKKDNGLVYQPLEHPDLRNIPQKHSDNRWNIISQNIPISSGRVLDIGSQWGYFSRKFERAGFTCFAIENNPSELYFLERLREVDGAHFTIIPKSIFDIEENEFDIVLALNIFHHFLKTEKEFMRLQKFLKDFKMNYMFFEPHDPAEEQMKNSFKNFKNHEFIDFILKNSCLNQYKFIGNDDGRNIYLLFKNP